MKPPDQCSYPDSPYPGHAHPSDWIDKSYSIVFTGVVLFILIFGIAIFLGYHQFETTRYNALTADKTTANLLASLVLEQNKATIGILQSYARRPLFIAAVKNKNLAGAYRHLSDLKKNAEIDLTFVTDKRGILWANFPVFPEAIGKDLSSRDWYKGISTHWKPYISTVFKLIVGDKPLAVAVCVPIFDEKERVIGIIGNSQRLRFIDDAIERVPFSPYTTVNMIDRTGHILYSNKIPSLENITGYRFLPIIEPALKEKKQQIEMNDPRKDQEKSYLTFVPIGDIGWTVIIERTQREIFRSELRRFIEIGALSFLLFLMIIFFLVYLRKASLFRRTEEILQAETKLRQSEESERETRDYLEKLFGYANAPIIVWNPQFRITRFNHAFEDLTDLKAEEVLGKEITLLFPEDRLEECFGHIRQATGGERWEVIEIPILHRDGSVRTVLWNSATIYSPDGKTAIATIAQGQDITSRKRAEEELKTSTQQLRALAARLQQIREEARIMIAREIHDELGGGLTGLKMDLSWLLHKVYDTEAGKERVALMNRIHESSELINRLIQIVRRIATDLRPSVLDDLGLIAALEWQLSEFTSRTGISHEFVTVLDYVNLEEATAVAVFRIFQETLTNVARHSGATKVTVRLREGEGSLFEGDSLCLEIRDNGRGIMEGEILDSKSLGILGMKERALVFGGDLRISGEPDSGTAVILKIPRRKGEPS